jgi:hypothetical protein
MSNFETAMLPAEARTDGRLVISRRPPADAAIPVKLFEKGYVGLLA